MEHAGKSWRVSTDGGAEFSAGSVLLTAPAPQSLDLLGAEGVNLLPAGVLDAVRNITFDPCLAVMVSLAGPGRIPAPGFVRPREGPVAFIADNARKGISGSDVNALTIHASPGFSRSSVDTPREETVAALLSAADPWLGSPVLSEESHFWKYSQPVVTWPEACLFTAQPAPLAFAGDAFAGARIEGAFLSGLAAAQRIMGI
jgi:predicted NAD/FAD-dependent oxidoreductase